MCGVFVTEFNADQKAAQTKFANLSKAVSHWRGVYSRLFPHAAAEFFAVPDGIGAVVYPI